MVDGGVSIAARSVYPGKQARLLFSEVLGVRRETGRQKVVPQTQRRRP